MGGRFAMRRRGGGRRRRWRRRRPGKDYEEMKQGMKSILGLGEILWKFHTSLSKQLNSSPSASTSSLLSKFHKQLQSPVNHFPNRSTRLTVPAIQSAIYIRSPASPYTSELFQPYSPVYPHRNATCFPINRLLGAHYSARGRAHTAEICHNQRIRTLLLAHSIDYGEES